MTDSETIKFISQSAEHVSVVFLLIIIIVGAVRQWWVPGWVYRKAVQDGNEYKSLLWQSLPMARQATQVAGDVVSVLKAKDGGGV